MKLLFIVKHREFPYTSCFKNPNDKRALSSGLSNSVGFVVNMLKDSGVNVDLESAIDGNCIDRLITEAKATHVILEALWCPPYKVEELVKLHPNVKWYVRLHSNTPFLANEGIAYQWLDDYHKLGVVIMVNDRRMERELHFNSIYLPNYYPLGDLPKLRPLEKDRIDIGCFGAIRPLKNQMIQAIAAIEYANKHKKKLFFHINSTRVEGSGESILKNLRNLFSNSEHVLAEWDWLPHNLFVELISSMDLLMQVSLTETYNIVAADAVSQNVAVVASNEIEFVNNAMKANPVDIKDILGKMSGALSWSRKFLNRTSYNKLKALSKKSRNIWLDALYAIEHSDRYEHARMHSTKS